LTGATGGIGKAVAHALAKHGAKLILSSRSMSALKELIADLPVDSRCGS